MERLGLRREDVATQVDPARPPRRADLARSRSPAPASSASRPRSATCSGPRCARSRSRSRAGQKGSSAMPHKRNPIRTERITGLARVLRGYAQAGLENVALWHERDISHSGAERVILPDATIGLDYMQDLATGSPRDDGPQPTACARTSSLTHGALFSQRALTALVESGHDPRRRLPRRPGERPARLGHRHRVPRAARRRRRPSSTSTPSSTTAPTSPTCPRSSSGSKRCRLSRVVTEHGDSAEADVVIVGAGLAGLVAARRLLAAGIEPIVVEARDRVGGRLLNEEIGGGKVVEVGGQWIGPTQERIAALAAELGVDTFPTHDAGRHLIEIAGKLASYSGPITDASPRLVRDLSRAISPLALIDFEQARARLDRMARSVPLEEPWLAAKALDWDGQTFATWVRRNTRTAAARTLFELRHRGGLGGRAQRRLAPSRPLLHALRQRLQHAARHRRRRPAGSLPRRLAAPRAADGRAAGRGTGAPGGAGAADRARARWRRPARRRRRMASLAG